MSSYCNDMSVDMEVARNIYYGSYGQSSVPAPYVGKGFIWGYSKLAMPKIFRGEPRTFKPERQGSNEGRS